MMVEGLHLLWVLCGLSPSQCQPLGSVLGTPRWWPFEEHLVQQERLNVVLIPNLCKQNPTSLLPQTYGHRQVSSSKSQMAFPLEDFQACERECSGEFPGLQRGKKGFA